MSQIILDKIKYLCQNIAKDEWSGPLFYTVEGSINKPKTFKITLQDILPLDKGSSSYTEYELDDRYVNYLLEEGKEERLDWTVGHIHSHNTMSVFFSGTDMSELNDNAPSHNYYLSLIVNNYMEFIAKVAFIGSVNKQVKNLSYKAQDENGNLYSIEKKNFFIEKKKLFIYDCLVLSPNERKPVEEDFMYKVAEIMKPKVVYTQKVFPEITPLVKQPVKAITPKQAPILKNFNTKIDIDKLSSRGKLVSKMIETIPFSTFDDLSDSFDMLPLEVFTAELMKFTTPLEVGENIEDVLETLSDLDLNAYDIAQSVLTNYTILYDKHFPDADDKEFIQDTYDVADILEDFLIQFPYLNITLESIKALITNFEKQNGTI